MRTTIDELIEDIECEGFDNALNYYADYSKIPDPKFQELYKQYTESRESLIEYLHLEVRQM
jgi:hypothetical protein